MNCLCKRTKTYYNRTKYCRAAFFPTQFLSPFFYGLSCLLLRTLLKLDLNSAFRASWYVGRGGEGRLNPPFPKWHREQKAVRESKEEELGGKDPVEIALQKI